MTREKQRRKMIKALLLRALLIYLVWHQSGLGFKKQPIICCSLSELTPLPSTTLLRDHHYHKVQYSFWVYLTVTLKFTPRSHFSQIHEGKLHTETLTNSSACAFFFRLSDCRYRVTYSPFWGPQGRVGLISVWSACAEARTKQPQLS